MIRVGAATETEMKYLKLKIEDAVNATKAAIEEGIVAGGGSALAHTAKDLTENYAKKKGPELTGDIRVGYSILVRALEKPLRQIALNAGVDDGVVLQNVWGSKNYASGYDVIKNVVVEDMFEAGIVDPVKVTRTGLERAASAAAILLTTDAAIAEEPEEKKPAAPDMGGMEY